MIQKRHLLNTFNEVSYFIETHDSVMDIVSQNICHSHLFKSNQDVKEDIFHKMALPPHEQ